MQTAPWSFSSLNYLKFMLLLQKQLGAWTACGIDKNHASCQTVFFFTLPPPCFFSDIPDILVAFIGGHLHFTLIWWIRGLMSSGNSCPNAVIIFPYHHCHPFLGTLKKFFTHIQHLNSSFCGCIMNRGNRESWDRENFPSKNVLDSFY